MTAATPTLIGSGWDAATDDTALLPHHRAEWVDGSAVAPELAAANVQSLRGHAVLEALVGDRLEQLYSRSTHYITTGQYGTGGMARLLQPLEPVAEAGGWWCAGLDPMAGWAPMGWGCLKADAPRQERRADGLLRARKYEHPTGAPARLFWLRVPAVVAQRVADRFGVDLPHEVAADASGDGAAFWRWWARTPALPLLLTEGAKKAAALLSAGLPAIGAPGIWNPAPRRGEIDPTTSRRTGLPELLPELAAQPLKGRRAWVLYDHSDSRDGREDVRRALQRVGRLLAAAGAEVLVGACPGPHKGADDHLAAGGSWEQLATALAPVRPDPALPRLRALDAEAPAEHYLGEAVAIPTDRKLVCLAAGMGAGKSQAMAAALRPLQQAGARVVLVTHRRSLGEALAGALGVPWGDDAAPGSDLRQTGIALCLDSLCRQSRLRFNPAEWRDAVVVIDEAAAVLAHALQGRGTAIAHRRPEVLDSLGQLLAGARAVWVADAQLDNTVVQTLEAITGERAWLIGSKRLPAAGRELVNHTTRESWRAALLGFLQRRERVWISTTAAEADSQNSATNLATLAAATWPGCRVLLVDRDTVADPDHDAHRLAAEPDRVAAGYDVVVASPAVAAGLSVTVRGHFRAVLGIAGGTTPANDVAQALSRVRDACPRHLFAPARSPGNALLIGCGSLDRKVVLRHLDRHAQAAVAAALAAGCDADCTTTGPWLPLWAAQAAQQNRARLTFRDTVLALLEREGYRVVGAGSLDPLAAADAKVAGAQLRALAEAAATEAQAAILAAPLLTDQEAADLQSRRRRLSPADRAALQRWRVDRAWGLQGAAPSPAILEAHEEGAHRKAVRRWAVTDPAADVVVARHDRDLARELAPAGRAWGPDLADGLMAPKVAALRALGLPGWLQRGEWFSAEDPALDALVEVVRENANDVAQCLGLRAGKRALTVLRQLLALVGARLAVERRRDGGGRSAAAAYRYRVVAIPLPDRIDDEMVVGAWCSRVGCVPKSPLQKERPIPVHTHG